MPRHRELTADELTALRAYAKQHGPQWKSRLRAEWYVASADGVLHALRNSHGPSWLTSYQLPPGRLDTKLEGFEWIKNR